MININTVYETVLTILNKEQRGYLDSEEFNNLARVVQREIFESYFLKSLAAPDQGDPVANPKMFIEEKIKEFEESLTITERAEDSFFLYPDNFYRLGVVINNDNNIIIDPVSHKDAAYLNLSHLTAPTFKQPIYVLENGGIQVYPDGVDQVRIVYLRTPNDPVWALDETIFADENEIVYNDDNSIQFELHPSELQELVIRICAYAGVVVRSPEVTAFAQQVEQRINSTEA